MRLCEGCILSECICNCCCEALTYCVCSNVTLHCFSSNKVENLLAIACQGLTSGMYQWCIKQCRCSSRLAEVQLRLQVKSQVKPAPLYTVVHMYSCHSPNLCGIVYRNLSTLRFPKIIIDDGV